MGSASATSDVGALVLTLGERSTAGALASVRSQSLSISEVVVIEGVRPFHRALNAGAERMTAPFFLQVDADFVLDCDCARILREAMEPDLGITVGPLRDPLLGPISGVKLFRRRCFDEACLRDTIAPEVDFMAELDERGWRSRYILAHRRGTNAHTLGAHRPAYTIDHVFGTYYLLGARYGAREDLLALQWRFAKLRQSRHAMAAVARVAMAHGIFAGELGDVPKPAPGEANRVFLRGLAGVAGEAPPRGDLAARAHPGDTFASLRRIRSLSCTAIVEPFLELGASLRTRSEAGFRDCLTALGELAHPHSLVAEAALGHGALAGPGAPISGPAMATLERLAAPHAPRLFPRPS